MTEEHLAFSGLPDGDGGSYAARLNKVRSAENPVSQLKNLNLQSGPEKHLQICSEVHNSDLPSAKPSSL